MRANLATKIADGSVQQLIERIRNGNRDYLLWGGENSADTIPGGSAEVSSNPCIVLWCCSELGSRPERSLGLDADEVFVVQSLATLPDSTSIESIAFALRASSIALIIILAHDDCGVPRAIASMTTVPPDWRSLVASAIETADQLPGIRQASAARLLALAAARRLAGDAKIGDVQVHVAVQKTDGSVEIPYECHRMDA
jgi:carbonic anhydrase